MEPRGKAKNLIQSLGLWLVVFCSPRRGELKSWPDQKANSQLDIDNQRTRAIIRKGFHI